jgi:alcohol dehydrogenase
VALEHQRAMRVKRIASAASDRGRQRLRPTRARIRALSISTGARFAWRSVPAPPSPGPEGAIVHPIAVATCDLDRALALGATPFPLPFHFGHECVAEVLAVGERVATVHPGDRVVVPFQISCGRCGRCRAGLTGNCESVPPISMYGFGVGGGHWGGAVSDQLAVPYADGMLVPLPAGIDPAAAASVADNVSDGYRHIGPHLPALLERDPASHVLIVGAMRKRSRFSASVPMYAGLIARAFGAREVLFVDARRTVRAQAERLGLTALAPSELQGLAPAPLVIDASASPRGLSAALSHTDRDGICSSIGTLHQNARIPAGLMYARNATFHIGRTHARAVIPRVLELIVDGRLKPEAVTTHVASLDEAPHALREHTLGDATKTILREA